MGLYKKIKKKSADDCTLSKISNPPPLNIANIASPPEEPPETPAKSRANHCFQGSANCNIPVIFAISGNPEESKREYKHPKSLNKIGTVTDRDRILQESIKDEFPHADTVKKIVLKKAHRIIERIINTMPKDTDQIIAEQILDQADQIWNEISRPGPKENDLSKFDAIIKKCVDMENDAM